MGPFPTELQIENGAVKKQPRGARDGTRTHDLLITNQLRYQLRHSSGYSVVRVGVSKGITQCPDCHRDQAFGTPRNQLDPLLDEMIGTTGIQHDPLSDGMIMTTNVSSLIV